MNASSALQRVADYCDGWLPIASRAGDLAAGIADLHRRTEKAGRDPRVVTVSVFGGQPEERAIQGYEKAGAERVVFFLPAADRDLVLSTLDGYARVLQTFHR